jgi:hypothetical protein
VLPQAVVAVADERVLPTRLAVALAPEPVAQRVTLEQTREGVLVAQQLLRATHMGATAALAVRGVQMALWAKPLIHQTHHSFLAVVAAQPVVL